MLEWFKRLFGWADEVVSLAERQAKANRLAAGAVSLFEGIVSDLEDAADQLKEVMADAQAEAAKLTAQAQDAADAVQKNLAQAAKIRGLLD